jgi:hypothetical protein
VIKAGDIVFDPKELAGIQYLLIPPEANAGIECQNWFAIIFRAPYTDRDRPQKFEMVGMYSEIKPIVDQILRSIIDAT